MTFVYLAGLIVAAVFVGWWLRGQARNPPDGTDPTFYAESLKRWREKAR